jgi:predicted nucleotidyltransferase
MRRCSARGDARVDSDTDIMIEIDPAAPVTVYGYVAIKDFIASLFDGPLDVVDREGLKTVRAARGYGGCRLCLLMLRLRGAV